MQVLILITLSVFFQNIVFYVVSDDAALAKANLLNVDENVFFMGYPEKSLVDGRDLIWEDQIGNIYRVCRGLWPL
jgi:hypothetical protein